MQRAIAMLIVGVITPATPAQEKTPEPNSVADFVQRPLEDNLTALKNKHKEIRQNAATALFWRNAIPDRVIPEIVTGLRDNDPFVRKQLLDVLTRLGIKSRAAVARAAVSTLRTMLKEPSPSIRMETAIVLRRIAASEPVVSVFIEALESPNLSIRAKAAMELGQIASRPKEAVGPLRKCLEDEETMVQRHAARALWLITRDPTALSLLLTTAKSATDNNRLQAIEDLGLPGMESSKVLPILREAVKEKSWLVRSAATRTLGKVNAKIEELLPLLLAALKDGESKVRSETVEALRIFGPSAMPAVPVLIEMLQRKDNDDRDVVLMTLLQIGPEARMALPAIRRFIDDDDLQTRILAAAAAWRLGDDAKGRDIVCEALNCKDDEFRTGAAHLLGEIGAPAKRMIPALRSLLRDPNAITRLMAAYSLWKLAADENAISVLIDSLHEEEGNVRAEAAVRLGMIGSAAKRAVSALKQAIHDDDDAYVQQRAAEALDNIIGDKFKPQDGRDDNGCKRTEGQAQGH